MIELLTALGSSVSPANPISMVSTNNLATARDRWLLAVVTVGTIWLAHAGLLWLALIGLWHLCRWRDHTLHASLLMWVAIGATWALLRTLPRESFTLISWAWVAFAGWQIAVCIWHWRTTDWSVIKRPSVGHRVKGTLGSPVLTAFYFTLVAPFCPWWAWPILGAGFYLTCSWSALIGLGVILLWLWPLSALPVALSALLVAILWLWSPYVRGQRLLEWTSRGDSVDGWSARWTLTVLLAWGWWTGGSRWLGQGPGSTTKVARQWSSRQHVELPNGDAHNDLLQLIYEMGVVGGLAALAFAWPILGHLRLGDPWSAAWVATVILSFGHWPMRHPVLGLMWLVISARLA